MKSEKQSPEKQEPELTIRFEERVDKNVPLRRELYRMELHSETSIEEVEVRQGGEIVPSLHYNQRSDVKRKAPATRVPKVDDEDGEQSDEVCEERVI